MNYRTNVYEPLVSIVIPVYNGSNYLKQAIDSALNQTYSKTEVIVVNDGSNDDGATRQIAESYGERIRYFEKENGGVSSALNYGIKHMKGEWFSWLSHDDLYDKDKVQEQIYLMNSITSANIDKYVFFSSLDFIDSKGKIIQPFNKRKSEEISKGLMVLDGRNESLIAEPTKSIFHGCSCLIHRNVFMEIGTFDESLRLLNDVDLWFRIYSEGYIIRYIPKPLVHGRVHAEQVSASIGYSYHNEEQDMFWSRSFGWLKKNFPNNFSLFYKYGKNAYSKTRYQNGKEAFSYLKKQKPKLKLALTTLECAFLIESKIRNFAKQIYLKNKL